MKTLLEFEVDDLPPSDNEIYRRGNSRNRYPMYMDIRGTNWKQFIGWQAKNHISCEPTGGKVIVNLEFIFTDNRRRDIQNFIKITLDALQGIVYKDDSQIIALNLRKSKGDHISTRIGIYKYDDGNDKYNRAITTQ